MTESFLLALFKRNINFKQISIERNDQYSEEIIVFIINHLNCLQYLNISKYGFNPLSGIDIEFSHLKNLHYLDLSGSVCDNRLMNNLLKTSSSLQILDLSYCTNMDDRAFNISQTNCPLQEINLTFIKKITDETLKNL